MKKILLSITAFVAVAIGANAQDTPLSISGYADTYYKFDFAERENIKTSFATDQNSVSLGMIGVALKKTTGKASFVGELSFGPRGQGQSIYNINSLFDESKHGFNIQNLNMTYAFTPEFSMAAGFFSTFVGYEVIAPTGNFNYSTSYLFTNGPFQNAGVKATYAFSPKVSLMVGGFNDNWNVYKAESKFGISTLGAQLMLAPVEGWSAYLNVLSGYVSGTILDLTSTYQVTKSFKVGVNAADWTAGVGNTTVAATKKGGYTGGALYLQNAFTEKFSLGVRGEYFTSKSVKDMDSMEIGYTLSGVAPKESVIAATLTANFKAGGLTFIPEVRLDNGSVTQFMKKNGTDMTKQATQASLAVVYAF
ncbi:MAG: porin [Sphingobacteriales bacterium]|nr:MAG: porin [Sphingobacteriales bacterium]